jgi:chorismate synthase
MSSSFGSYIKIALFGQSHGDAVGIVVDGLPAGMPVDWGLLRAQMERRMPDGTELTTSRLEKDNIQIVSGIMNDLLTGQPVCALIRNTDAQPDAYESLTDILRPGHADYTGAMRYRGFGDLRGGGHFSGRLTAPIVFAGTLCAFFLQREGIQISAKASHTGGETEPEPMKRAVLRARSEGDSVGGVIRCCVTGMPAGIGAPFFDSAESVLSHLLFSIPGVKAVSFGDGIACADLKGSAYNDAFIIKDGRVATATNHTGGIQGGVTNGADLFFDCYIRPPASIAKPQRTVSLKALKETTLALTGRHDPCIVPRAVPVVEAMAAIGLAELWKERQSG